MEERHKKCVLKSTVSAERQHRIVLAPVLRSVKLLRFHVGINNVINVMCWKIRAWKLV